MASPQGRLADKSSAPKDVHGCSKCPHQVIGPALQGSQNVLVNSRPALRVGDKGIHLACCGSNIWTAVEGSDTVFINGQPAYRKGDKSAHCGGDGKLTEGSGNVLVGDSGGKAGYNCNPEKLMKDAAASGTPFVEAPMTGLERFRQSAMDAAMGMVNKEIQKIKNQLIDKAVSTVTCAVAKGLGAEKYLGVINGITNFAMSGGLSGGAKSLEVAVTSAGSFTVKETVAAGMNQNKSMENSTPPLPVYDGKSPLYGNENAQVTIGGTKDL